MRGSTCLGRLSAHHQERTTALGGHVETESPHDLLGHDQQCSDHHAPTVEPEAPSAVVRS